MSDEQQHPWEAAFVRSMIRHREALGISPTGLAKRLTAQGLAFYPQTVQRIESGERPVRLNEAVLIVRELQMSPDDTLGLDAAVGGDEQQAIFTLHQTMRAVELHLAALDQALIRDVNRAAELAAALLGAQHVAGVEEGSELDLQCRELLDRLHALDQAFEDYRGLSEAPF